MLAQHRARRVRAEGGDPCRVSLTDAAEGEPLILANYVHQPADTPFHASHAIFVREGAHEARPEPGEVPTQFRRRQLSLRAFDDSGMIRTASIVPGEHAADALADLLATPTVNYVHLHFAAYGCYAARATRVP